MTAPRATTADPFPAEVWRELAPHLHALATLAEPRHADQRKLRLDYQRLNDLVTLVGEAATSLGHLVDLAVSWLPEAQEHDAQGQPVPGPIRARLTELLAALDELPDMADAAKTHVEQMDDPE